MEKFQQLDWTTDVEDIVDKQFLSEDRLQTESAMYKIMNGHFRDPFQNIRPFAYQQQESKPPANKNQKQKQQQQQQQQPKKFADKPSLGVAVRKRGRPKKNKVDN